MLSSSHSTPYKPHLLIRSDNLAAHDLLVSEVGAGADLIYIDPPYNTGRSRTYSDTKSTQAWREMMRPRLVQARELLAPLGVVAVSIDDRMHHHLRLLLDEVLGEDNHLATITWQGGVSALSPFTGGGVDYFVVYARDRRALVASGARWEEQKPDAEMVLETAAALWSQGLGPEEATAQLRAWIRAQGDATSPGTAYYNAVDAQGRVYRRDNLGQSDARHVGPAVDLLHPVSSLPCRRPAGGWRYSEERLQDLLAQGRIGFGPTEQTVPYLIRFLAENSTQRPRPTFYAERSRARDQLTDLLGEHRFDNPKDPRVLAHWFKIWTGDKSDALVLDTFAGSGSTVHAVMLANAQDGGARRAIAVTTNEVNRHDARKAVRQGADLESLGVFERVTSPRLRAVTSGLRPDGTRWGTGLEAEVREIRTPQDHEEDPGRSVAS